MYPTTGYTRTVTVQPATKAQLIALRDLLLSHNDKNAAAAVDNVIDILTRAAKVEDEIPSDPIAHLRKIVFDENGKLRPYSSFPRRRGNIADDHEIHAYTVDGS